MRWIGAQLKGGAIATPEAAEDICSKRLVQNPPNPKESLQPSRAVTLPPISGNLPAHQGRVSRPCAWIF